MAAEKRPEWLPAGWSMEVRTRMTGTRAGAVDRYYTSPEIKYQFRSKNEIIRYFESRNLEMDVNESISTTKARCAATEKVAVHALAVVEKSEDTPTWLPPGWTMEVRTRKGGLRAGTRYKCYIDPLSGCKFYSKAEVINYVQAGPMGSKSHKRKRRSINALSMDNQLHSDRGNGCISHSKSASVQLDEGAELGNYVSVPVNSVDYALSTSLKESKRPKTGVSNARRCLFAKTLNQRDELHSVKPLMVAPISYIPMEEIPSVKESSEPEGSKNLVNDKLLGDGINGEKRAVDNEKQPKNGVSFGTEHVLKAEDTVTSQKLEESMAKENATPMQVEIKLSANSTSLQLDENKLLENKGQTVESKQKAEQVLPDEENNKPPENQEVSCKAETTQSFQRKRRAGRPTDLPRRTSKRLAGLKPDVDLVSADPELTLRRGKLGTKAKSSSPRDSTGGSEEFNQLKSHIGASQNDQRVSGSKRIAETILNTKPEAGNLVSDNSISPLISPFGDSWPDPCLEFAFKTLTDAIPVDYLLQADFFPADKSAQLKSLTESRRENVAKG